MKQYFSKIDQYRIINATIFAMKEHGSQLDKSNIPYQFHLLRVMLKVLEREGNVDQIIAAVLHDIVEDTEVTLKVIEYNFGPQVAKLVDALTHPPNEPNIVYINRVINCLGASLIKYCDVEDNFNRLDKLNDEETVKRLTDKYSLELFTLQAQIAWENDNFARDWNSKGDEVYNEIL